MYCFNSKYRGGVLCVYIFKYNSYLFFFCVGFTKYSSFIFLQKRARTRSSCFQKNTKLSPTTAQHLVGVKTVKKTILGGKDDGQSHALSNWQFPIALSKSGLKKLIRLKEK